MEDIEKKKIGTKAIHAGQEPDASTGAVMTPIFQTSTYAQAAPGDHKGFEYSRTGNPTRTALESNMAAIENGKYGICFASGMAATDTVMKLLKPGDEVIANDDLYGGSYRLFKKVYEEYGIKFNLVSMENAGDVEKHITDNTKLIWIETPTNPLLHVIDIQAIGETAKSHNLTFVVDNTFASPYLQNPLDMGADIVMHSITKYIGGHSDVVMGALVTRDEQLAEELLFFQNTCGAVPGPMDSFLVLRGIKTLHVRMQRHCENAAEIAELLSDHPKVDKVYWPGLSSHPNHEIAARQMKHFGAMMSFTLKGDKLDDAFELMKNVKVFSLAESLGGVESLIGHPASMTHAAIPKAERDQRGVVDSLIRLSVGIEDIGDLKEDMQKALDKI